MDFDPVAATDAYLATLAPAQLAKAIAYTRGKHWLIFGEVLVDLTICWLVVRTNVLTWARDRTRGPWQASLLVSALFLALDFVLSLPWSIYEGWYREKAYGLNNQTLLGWLGDALKGGAVSWVAGSAFMVLFYALIRIAKRSWWIWATGLTAGFMVVTFVLSPVLIEPMFNTYEPAPEGPVRAAVVALAHQTGTPDDKIYVYDGTRQSDRYTANVSGLFGSARVALSDAMFKKNADLREVRAVVAHEMGHYVRHHGLWNTAVHTLFALLSFWLLDRLFPFFRRALAASRVRSIDDPAGLPVLMAILALVGLLVAPMAMAVSRTIEADADHFSLVHANEPDGMAEALLKTAEYRAPSPTPLEELLFYSHPSIEHRIRAAMEWKRAHPAHASDAPATSNP